MTEQEAIQIALDYASARGLTTRNAVITATFCPRDSPFNIWKDPDDKWMVFVTFPLLEGMDPNFFTIQVNCRTKTASHRPVL